MMMTADHRDYRLLDEFQRDLPLVPRPFATMADVLDMTEAEVIQRLVRLQQSGLVARIGATVRPNTVGASTLAAMSVASARIDEVASLLAAEPGVNHSYLREDEWNLWFVVTAPDGAMLEATLARIRQATALRVLDLRLVRPFHIDLGFRLGAGLAKPRTRTKADVSVVLASDRPLLQALCEGLPLVPEPYAALANRLGVAADHLMERIGVLCEAGVISRFGVIVRHRTLGWTSNAMVVWSLQEDTIAEAGAALARHPGVTLCYQRRMEPDVWPYQLYAMVHGRSRPEALATIQTAAAIRQLAGAAHRILFSTHCFKQTGAQVGMREAAE